MESIRRLLSATAGKAMPKTYKEQRATPYHELDIHTAKLKSMSPERQQISQKIWLYGQMDAFQALRREVFKREQEKVRKMEQKYHKQNAKVLQIARKEMLDKLENLTGIKIIDSQSSPLFGVDLTEAVDKISKRISKMRFPKGKILLHLGHGSPHLFGKEWTGNNSLQKTSTPLYTELQEIQAKYPQYKIYTSACDLAHVGSLGSGELTSVHTIPSEYLYYRPLVFFVPTHLKEICFDKQFETLAPFQRLTESQIPSWLSFRGLAMKPNGIVYQKQNLLEV